jgi:hypothetical protein
MKLTRELGGQMVSEDVRVHHVSWPNHVMQPRWQRGRRSRPDSSPWFAGGQAFLAEMRSLAKDRPQQLSFGFQDLS